MVDAFGADGYFESVRDIRLDLLELLGRGYVVENCIAFFKIKREREKYLMYYADCLSILTDNTARYTGGKYIKRLSEIEKPEEKRTASEIIDSIKAKLREV